jgi:hypothetical protein
MKDTIESIRYLLGDLAIIRYLRNYPKEDKYIEISLIDIPFNISKGYDEFCYNGYKTKSKRELWYVSKNDCEFPDLYIQIGFTSYQKAISETSKEYQKEIKILNKSLLDFKTQYSKKIELLCQK